MDEYELLLMAVRNLNVRTSQRPEDIKTYLFATSHDLSQELFMEIGIGDIGSPGNVSNNYFASSKLTVVE